ncbi:hypothetical protein BSU04_05595 [Caballeronia sordidicola]|uniref:Uncharacterized protein n=1 Tax=Caballeronia sordidicola TaxID=196367 RepID=A0A226X8C5_CABSO|nr:hypothetical protein BSU04_05595 [Caballeronia sordidicola]
MQGSFAAKTAVGGRFNFNGCNAALSFDDDRHHACRTIAAWGWPPISR